MPGTTPPIRVLHLEDSARDAAIIRDTLESGGPACDVVHVDSRARFESALAGGPFDVIICDFNLPDFRGMAALRLVKDRRPETPVIMVSGAIDPAEAVECLKQGATDYVLKQRLERLPSAVNRAIEEAEQRRQRLQMDAKLRESEERFRLLAEQSNEGFWFVALNPERISYVSPAVEKIWGLSAESFYQDSRIGMGAIHPDDRTRITGAWEAWAKGQAPRFEEECRIVQPDGSVRWVLMSGTPIRNEAGALTGLSGLTQDITERMELEAQFRQVQKMESVGRLAGGIAHDFNNLLTVINGTTELALLELGDAEALRADLDEIRLAGERAAALTRQLLAFSRKQILQPQVLNLNTVVAGMKGMLGRLLGEDVHLVFALTDGLGSVRADVGQIEQVVVNLVVNARDAMPHGGTLTIETRNAQIDERRSGEPGFAAPEGPHVILAVADTGMGMDEVTRRQIFEPFFTTKDPGRGTGLGLSTVYGIIKQSDGLILVESEVGRGTRFEVCLPQVAEVAGGDRPKPTVVSASGTETILLVEDNGGLRKLARRILVSAGYRVLPAANGEEALLVLERHEEPVHLLLTDVIMPGMNGRVLAEQVGEVRPGMKVLYTSGYTDDAIVHHGVLDEGTAFVGKPFTAAELLRKVREVLDSQ